jgi:Fe2+ or Zn2+ uptake regulation protein/O6-methylguanine-DNA--protein-cysteine methyltransferase
VPTPRFGKLKAMTASEETTGAYEAGPNKPDAGAFLRSRGLRVTPQRRAILDAFSNGAAEHLSADEIHARASAVIPELGRGTVYAALAELTELGILAALGSPEPVRYETNVAPHQHFRCRLCLRSFDVEIPEPDTEALTAAGYVLEAVTIRGEGVCAQCVGYDDGLHAGASHAREVPAPSLPAGLAATTVETPIDALTLAATPAGLVRVVFDNHADVPMLRAAIRARRGSRAAREHLAAATAAVEDYFAGRPPGACAIDWDNVEDPVTLRAVMAVPRGKEASYETLETPAEAEGRGRALGANPLAILVPCHRVIRGAEVPAEYVGGAELRRALRALERPA